MSKPVTRRHDFVFYFDVTNGNPNGDPDNANMPRLDPETGQGLVTDVALKRRVRNYISLLADAGEIPVAGNEIYVSGTSALNLKHAKAWQAVFPDARPEDLRKDGRPLDEDKASELTRWMCANFWDIRTFGAVMTTKVNAGQVRGPVQLTFARSIETVMPLEIAITRMAATAERDDQAKGGRTMGRKYIIPYGLYRAHGFVSAPLASHRIKGTGFSEGDLELLWRALCNMFDHDRSASRGDMVSRKLVVFRHDSCLGNARAQDLFDRVRTWRLADHDRHPTDDATQVRFGPSRSWQDYEVSIDREGLPRGVEIFEMERT